MTSTLILASSTGLAQETKPPNILFIISDDLQACMGCYGNTQCKTPNIDRLAANGVIFENAYCQYPVCGASRASLMSGLYPHRTRMLGNSKVLGSFHRSNPELANHPSMGGFLRRNGYVSMRISKIYHMGIPGGIEAGEPGGDDPDSWDEAFDMMAPETASIGELKLLSPIRKHYGSNFAKIEVPDEFEATQTDAMATTQAIAILENRARGRKDSRFLRPQQPFFLAVGMVRPHVPLIAPKRIFKKYPVDQIELPFVPEGDLDDVPKAARGMDNQGRYGMSIQQQKEALAAYYASVTYMDEQVGRLLDALDRLKLRDDTIVVFTADHGYNLGEHHCWQKLSLFEDSTRVPLVVSAPMFQKSHGQRSQRMVELIDLYPTFADLAGLSSKAPSILQGKSLRPLLDDPKAKRDKPFAHTVTYQKGESIRTERWRYNIWNNSGEELYDHQSDPDEFTNLADSDDHKADLEAMQFLMKTARERRIE